MSNEAESTDNVEENAEARRSLAFQAEHLRSLVDLRDGFISSGEWQPRLAVSLRRILNAPVDELPTVAASREYLASLKGV